jgi:hypothetical protein
MSTLLVLRRALALEASGLVGANDRLLETTLERRRDRFEPLILAIVREGLKYRQRREPN